MDCNRHVSVFNYVFSVSLWTCYACKWEAIFSKLFYFITVAVLPFFFSCVFCLLLFLFEDFCLRHSKVSPVIAMVNRWIFDQWRGLFKGAVIAHLSRVRYTWIDDQCLLILAWSLCNRLSLYALILDSMSSAQPIVLYVLILLLCNDVLGSGPADQCSWL